MVLEFVSECEHALGERFGQYTGASLQQEPASNWPLSEKMAETNQGRGMLGVIDDFPPKGVEGEDDVAWRKNLLRQFGYKL